VPVFMGFLFTGLGTIEPRRPECGNLKLGVSMLGGF
jgi:hypothetical protein